MQAIAEGIGGEDAALMAGVLRAMRAAPELGSCMRDQVIEAKRSSARTIVARAVARGELPPAADPGPLHEIAPALVFWLLFCGQPLDEPFREHVVDDVLIPLLNRRRFDDLPPVLLDRRGSS